MREQPKTKSRRFYRDVELNVYNGRKKIGKILPGTNKLRHLLTATVHEEFSMSSSRIIHENVYSVEIINSL